MIELNITVRNSDCSLTDKHVLYDPIVLSKEDPQLRSLVEKAVEKFIRADTPETPSIVIKGKLIYQ